MEAEKVSETLEAKSMLTWLIAQKDLSWKHNHQLLESKLNCTARKILKEDIICDLRFLWH
jgi:hypothetical protein